MTELYLRNVRQLRRPVDPKAPIHRRMSAKWLAELHTAVDRMPCIVEDISAGGAKLLVGPMPSRGEAVALVVVDFGPVAARVAWRRGDRIGLRFAERQIGIAGMLAKAAKQGGRQARGRAAKI